MRSKLFCAVAGMVVSAVAMALLAAAPGDKGKTAWEYRFVQSEYSPSDPASTDGPNALGTDGWELVSATADAKNNYWLYFKRPK